MHIVKDENGNLCPHGHHEHTHTHTYEHSHEHSHAEGHEDEHEHSHEDAGHCQGTSCQDGGHCHGHEGHCHSHGEEEAPGSKTEAILKYMLDHNTHHAAELDQMAEKLTAEGQEKAAEQIRKAVDEFQKGNLYLGLALSLVKQ